MFAGFADEDFRMNMYLRTGVGLAADANGKITGNINLNSGRSIATNNRARWSNQESSSAGTNNQATRANSGNTSAAQANEAGVEQINLQQRAQEIHSQQPAFAKNMTTTAVGTGTSASGQPITLVASSNARLSTTQRAALKPGEIPINNKMLNVKSRIKIHAEQKITLYANMNNIQLSAVAPSRPACPSCLISVNSAGAQLEGRIKKSVSN